jgi:hypothetical protein
LAEIQKPQKMIDYLIENKEQLFGIVTAVIAAASAIAALTPTPKDDTIIGKAYKLVDWLALNVFKAKDK